MCLIMIAITRRLYIRFLSTKFATKVIIGLILFIFFCVHFGLIAPLLSDAERPFQNLESDGILGLFGPRKGERKKYPVNYTSPWTWGCGDDGKCHRKLQATSETGVSSLEACWLTCGTYRTLWPKPKSFAGQTTLGYETLDFLEENLNLLRITTQSDNVKKLAEDAFHIFKENVKKLLPADFANIHALPGKVTVSLNIKSPQVALPLLTNENYDIYIKEYSPGTLTISISGETFFGVRHGLETLSQLIVFDSVSNSLKILKEVKLTDGPAFPYRGLMIDTARNFISIPSLERMVDAMGQNKLNVLHWHISDSNSFPLFCPSFPQMTDYGAYSKDEIYHPEEVKEFIKYALLRGVKVIPEIDAPAHAGNGWQWGNDTNGYGELALCVNDEPFNSKCGQPPCGQLNPANPKVFEVLGGIYRDMLKVFDPDLFHMGGDEVNYRCWKNKETRELRHKHNMTANVMVRTYFQAKALEALKKGVNTTTSGKTPIPIIWTSDLTKALPKLNNSGINATEYIIQFWEAVPSKSADMKALLDANFPVIVSNFDFMYLDLGAGAWIGRTDNTNYINWQVLYEFDFAFNGYNLTKRVFNAKLGDIPQILGCEAPLWSEKANEDTMDAKLWPRGAALAERLWTNPHQTDIKMPLVYARLLRHNERMRQRGIRSEARQPRSCLLINGSCQNIFDTLPALRPIPRGPGSPTSPVKFVASTPPPVAASVPATTATIGTAPVSPAGTAAPEATGTPPVTPTPAGVTPAAPPATTENPVSLLDE